MAKVSWTTIKPEDAKDIQLSADHPEIEGPINEMGEVCPWPWDPQQLVNAPLGMYHCPYCGGMVMAGAPHTDWRDAEETNYPEIERDDIPDFGADNAT